jgi:alpha-L-fucosidase 2
VCTRSHLGQVNLTKLFWYTEWKVDLDSPTDTHRHLSHLIGLFPGYAVANYDATKQSAPKTFTRAEVLAAAEVSLIHRGNGTGPDADSGEFDIVSFRNL